MILDLPPLYTCTCRMPGQDHFWALNFHLLTDLQNFFGTFFRTFDKIILKFVCGCFETKLHAKRLFLKDDVRRVETLTGQSVIESRLSVTIMVLKIIIWKAQGVPQ